MNELFRIAILPQKSRDLFKYTITINTMRFSSVFFLESHSIQLQWGFFIYIFKSDIPRVLGSLLKIKDVTWRVNQIMRSGSNPAENIRLFFYIEY